tara:strand:+ start:609395 stop:612292 length:2898 start_codon:yes stop_codon:yes gene_type:complete
VSQSNDSAERDDQSAQTDPLAPSASKFVVGIDLGTTNCAMCFVDTDQEDWSVKTFPIPQWVDLGLSEDRETLPSFHYELTADERARSHRLPWESDPSGFCVGTWARDAGIRMPGRRAASAKSWLSHDGVDRTAKLLPWHGDPDVDRLSPVEVSSRYLAHLRQAWDNAFRDHPLADQDVVITLPASFDEVARELTIAAAKTAGLPRVYLIEEPQAAFYAWISRQGEDWQKQVTPGQLILVCDIGGGTTDLTLIRVRTAGDDSDQVQFHRVAVGNHLMLGGDNMDLALAKLAESEIIRTTGQELSPAQWDRLVQVSRGVKETMLSATRPDSYTINLPAEGSRLVGGAIQTEVSADAIDSILLDGFFPQVQSDAVPLSGESGFQEFGLPYAADAAITRHLAAFLSQHRRTGIDADDSDAADRPDLILFNGGALASTVVQDRIVGQVSGWFGDHDAWSPKVLSSPRLDLAVAHGAAYYAMVRRGKGVRIAANLGRSYYIQVESDPARGLCLIPGDAEAGQNFRTDNHPLQLQIGSPAQFPLWVSSTRLADKVGEVVEIDRREFSPLPPICTALMLGKQRQHDNIEVIIESELSEIGTVGLYCVDPKSNRRWRLDFDIRSTLETDRSAHKASGESSGIVDAETIDACSRSIDSVFGDQRTHKESTNRGYETTDTGPVEIKPGKLVKHIQSITESSRHAWPPSLLREFWHVLMEHESGRRKSPQHESRWLNMVGFCLRPGYGVAVDDWRVDQTWRAIHGKLAFADVASRYESMILWRRIAGGLMAGQQTQLAAPLISALKNKSRRFQPNEIAEAWRLLGSLERLTPTAKMDLANVAMTAVGQQKNEKLRPALLWALGRIASRQVTYGPLNCTVPAEPVSQWIDELIRQSEAGKFADCDRMLMLTLVQMSRRTGDRFRDLPSDQLSTVVKSLRSHDAPDHYVTLITEGGSLDAEEEEAIFGESLPLGIRLVR